MDFDFLKKLYAGYKAYKEVTSDSKKNTTMVAPGRLSRSASRTRGERPYGGSDNRPVVATTQVTPDVGISPISQQNTILGYIINSKYTTKSTAKIGT